MLALRRLLVVAVLLTVGQVGYALTVDEVISLSKANVGEEVIISQIDASGTVFVLSANDLIRLKENAVTDRVMLYMIKTRTASPAEQAPAPKASIRERLAQQSSGNSDSQVRGDDVNPQSQNQSQQQYSQPQFSQPQFSQQQYAQPTYQAPTTVYVPSPTYVVQQPVYYSTPTYYYPAPAYYGGCHSSYYTPTYYAPAYYPRYSYPSSSFSLFYGHAHHHSAFGFGLSFGGY